MGKIKASFLILHDQHFAIMKAYRTAFRVEPATAVKYKGFGLDLQQSNGASDDVPPMPAAYIIGQNGKINFAYFNPDHRKQLTVKQLMQAL